MVLVWKNRTIYVCVTLASKHTLCRELVAHCIAVCGASERRSVVLGLVQIPILFVVLFKFVPACCYFPPSQYSQLKLNHLCAFCLGRDPPLDLGDFLLLLLSTFKSRKQLFLWLLFLCPFLWFPAPSLLSADVSVLGFVDRSYRRTSENKTTPDSFASFKTFAISYCYMNSSQKSGILYCSEEKDVIFQLPTDSRSSVFPSSSFQRFFPTTACTFFFVLVPQLREHRYQY